MAYAVAVSLEQTLETLLEFQIPAKSEISTNSELKLIYEQLCYVKSFFEKTISLEDSNNVEEVERDIKDVVQNAQDLIESHLSDLFLHRGAESWISGFYPELVKVNAKLGPLVKELKAMEDYLTGDQQPPAGFGNRNENMVRVGAAAAASSSLIDLGRNDVIVGMEWEICMLMDRLIGGEYYSSNDLNVICIVGMGGSGKTTLAKQVYLDPLTIHHYDVRLFVEIGVEYKLEELLLSLVSQVGSMKRDQLAGDELGLYLYQCLYGRRFLIVLDDMWDIEVWHQLHLFFPNNINGSSIILTSRISSIARDLCSTDINVVEKQFLDNETSWELLQKMALPDIDMDRCPWELESVGRSIAQNLGGLPLGIVMIGKLLSRLPRTPESWRAVAESMHSPIWQSDVPAYLSLSYTQLPQHLKACFLYLGLFPPNSKIPTALLIKLWIAEGFIEEGGGYYRSLEEKAEEYLLDLVGRSLVTIDERRSIGGIKTCRVHQLLLDLCISEARQQKLFHIVNEGSGRFSKKNQRRLGTYRDIMLGCKEPDCVRSLVFICPQSEQPLELNLGFRLLRVLHALSFRVWEFPDEVVKLVRLKYLAITCDGELPSSISRLRNLEFLIIHRSLSIDSHVFLPLEIWKLQKLRHLECMGFDLPDPSIAAAVMALDNVVYLTKLVTLLGVSYRTCIESVLARMPSLIKLGVQYEPTCHSIELLCFEAVSTCLHRLESFKFVAMYPGFGSEVVFSLNRLLPYGLIKLTLSGCEFDWGEHMTLISQLPNLQLLKLRWRAFCGPEWETSDGDFLRLKLLVLEDLDLESLNANSSHFPVLEQLHIRRCYNLTEIPEDIGEIATLQVIVLDECSDSANDSARIIKDEQKSMGNDIQLQIQSSSNGY